MQYRREREQHRSGRPLPPLRAPFPFSQPLRKARVARERRRSERSVFAQPFSPDADPRFFYHSTRHDVVVQELLTAIRDKEAIIVLTGDAGTGKTTVCRTVIEHLDRRTLASFVPEPFTSVADLLRTVLIDFGVMSPDELARQPSADRRDLSRALHSFVESLAPLGARAVVMIDDAQMLSPAVLGDLLAHMLHEFGDGLLQIVLVGQPRLERTLRRRELRVVAPRIARRCELGSMPMEEIAEYVRHRLSVARVTPQIDFDEAALARIYALSSGVPQVINLICARALARGSALSTSRVDAATVDRAARDLDLDVTWSPLRRAFTALAIVAGLVACLLAGAASAAWIFHDAAGVGASREPVVHAK